MKMNKKKVLLFPILIVLVLLLSGISLVIYSNKNPHPRQTLTIGLYTGSSWNVPNDQQYHMIDYAIHEFKKEHPNVKIKYESGVCKSDYINWLSEKIVNGQTPDVVMMPPEYFNLFASEKTFKDLSSYIKKDNLTSKFYAGSLAAGNYQGKQYTLPYETNPTLLIANQNLLYRYGIKNLNSVEKINNFRTICHQISQHKKFYGVTSSYDWIDAQLAFHTNLFSGPNHSLQLTNTSARNGFNLIEDLNNDNQMQNVNNENFDCGEVAFMPLNFAQYRTYTSYPYHVTQDTKFREEELKMPGQHSTPSETVGFGISSQSHKDHLAWEFIKLLCSNQKTQQELMKTDKGCSVMPSVIKSKKTANILRQDNSTRNSINNIKLDKILRDTAITPKFRNYKQVMERLDYQIQQSLSNGNLDLDLFNIQQNINRQIE